MKPADIGLNARAQRRKDAKTTTPYPSILPIRVLPLSLSPCLPASLSVNPAHPCSPPLLVSLPPCLLIRQSCPSVFSPSPCPLVSLSPCPPGPAVTAPPPAVGASDFVQASHASGRPTVECQPAGSARAASAAVVQESGSWGNPKDCAAFILPSGHPCFHLLPYDSLYQFLGQCATSRRTATAGAEPPTGEMTCPIPPSTASYASPAAGRPAGHTRRRRCRRD